jgi:hypothetical protein
MTAPQRAQFSCRGNLVDEMFTEANIAALNAKLIEQGIFRRSGDRHSAGGSTDDGQSDATAVPGAVPDCVIGTG